MYAMHPSVLRPASLYDSTSPTHPWNVEKQARSQITGPGGGSLAAFSFPDRNAAGGAVGGAGGAADDEEEDLYS